MDNTTQDYVNQSSGTKKSKLPIVIIVVVLLVVLAGGFLLFRNKSKQSEKPQVAAASTEAPTPTPTPAIDKMSVKIQVLNGTGTPGQAGKVAVTLKNAGYNLDNIKTGNAPADVTSSTISAKTGFENTAGDLKTALSSDYTDISVDTSLGSDSEFDIVVTIGGTKYVAPTSTPTPAGSDTPTPTPTGTSDTPTPTPTPTITPTPTLTPTPTP